MAGTLTTLLLLQDFIRSFTVACLLHILQFALFAYSVVKATSLQINKLRSFVRSLRDGQTTSIITTYSLAACELYCLLMDMLTHESIMMH